MALPDPLLFYTLVIQATDDPDIVELVKGTVRKSGRFNWGRETWFYRVKENVEGEVYSVALYDAKSHARLGSAGFISNNLKSMRLQLHAPDENIPFELTGKFWFEWTFTFENNRYSWTRSGKKFVCSMDRGSDPPVDMCLALPARSKQPEQIEIIHYNINRFDEIKDQQGLETLVILTYSCLRDVIKERLNRRSSPPKVPPKPKATSPVYAPASPSPSAPPPEEYEPEDENEVIVGLTTNEDEHVSRAIKLLEDPNIHFIIIRTRNPEAAKRAMDVSYAVTRHRHRECLPALKQYTVQEEEPKPPGPRVINLDDIPPKKPWTPPNVAIYLSTIELPELTPKPSVKGKEKESASGSSSPREEWLYHTPPPTPLRQSRVQQLMRPRSQSSPPAPGSVGQKEKGKEKEKRSFIYHANN